MTKYKADDITPKWKSLTKPNPELEKYEKSCIESSVRQMNEIYELGQEVVKKLKAQEQTKPDRYRTMNSADDRDGKERLANYLTKSGVKSAAGTLGSIHTEKVIDDLITRYLDNSDD